ncbi:Glycosyltransferase, GT2 family [Quadrisphaera granulorum]|uniref:GT2 family glycosyltransferase n=1 Tax=Quadrisphaera granulorum TaxID=317664 RepID=A0A316ADT3_9ACTN|nr:glycosyltransferase [Quadrisphaera granulorum]PWJ55130.1 GT2 family glycosyltransferase [Quadrisphaera granulorum]SZE95639.1 Glycosyltransferase, GT2 family [Quadrisphaera granulorum]
MTTSSVSSTPTSAPRVAVVLASAGRPALLAEVLADLRRQTYTDLTTVVSVPDAKSLPDEPLPEGVLLVHARGLTSQRNAGMDAVPDATHVFFFDDDAVVRPDFIERAMNFFKTHPEVVALTGRVLLDGAVGTSQQEISLEEASRALEASSREPLTKAWRRSRTLYGCNFAVTRAAGERFDDRLPLYGWLEDHDYARRMMRHGVLAKVDDCVIVHRGVRSGGRTAHERLGYFQVMNPAYLHHVGSFPLWLLADEMGRRVVKNAVFSIAHPERSWRRRRLVGNLRAFGDVARGRFTPERALEIPAER